jgi:hypothetical protein
LGTEKINFVVEATEMLENHLTDYADVFRVHGVTKVKGERIELKGLRLYNAPRNEVGRIQLRPLDYRAGISKIGFYV